MLSCELGFRTVFDLNGCCRVWALLLKKAAAYSLLASLVQTDLRERGELAKVFVHIVRLTV